MTLPPPDTHCWDEDTSKDVWSHSADQMRAYAEQAIAAERERCAAICDARSADHWRAYSDKSSPHFCDARFEAFSDEAEECATLIRGDNVEFSGVPAGHSSNHPAGGTSAGTKC